MKSLYTYYNCVFAVIGRVFGSWFLPTFARFTFVAVLFHYFWNSAKTKLGDGFLGLFPPSDNAYMQIFPKTFEAMGYDSSGFGIMYALTATLGTAAEFILPILLVLGLFTRLAALGMAVFVLVQSYVDVTGHGKVGDDLGAWFDGTSNSLIMDQRLLWMVLFAILVLKGAGPIALDRVFKR